MDPFPLPDGLTPIDPQSRCIEASLGYGMLGMFDEARRELADLDDLVRQEWDALSPAQQDLRRKIAAECREKRRKQGSPF